MLKQTLILIVLFFVSSVSASTLLDKDLKAELYSLTSSQHKSFSYREARRILFNELHLKKDNRGYYVFGVYCSQKYYPFNGDAPGNRIPNSNVLNTEHTWPQSKFSSQFGKDVQKTDLHHLFPTGSRINSDRGNFPFAEVYDEDHVACGESHKGSPISGGNGTYFEPPATHKGNVARAMFYFSVRYKSSIDPVQESYLRQWHKDDPVDDEEMQRNEAISKLQKNRNPFIDHPEYVDQISDF